MFVHAFVLSCFFHVCIFVCFIVPCRIVFVVHLYTVFQKTSTHIIGYKLRNSCPILIIFDNKIPHII